MAIVAYPQNGVDPDEYRSDVATTLAKIYQRAPSMGQALLSRLEHGPYTVYLTPLPEPVPGQPGGGPVLDAALGTGATDRRHAYRHGGLVREGGTAIPLEPWRWGTGRGSDSAVGYSGSYFPNPYRAPVPPDEYLFHELVHAFANAQGLADNRKLPTEAGAEFATVNEFRAITLTNMYRSEAGAGLRWDHSSTVHDYREERVWHRSTRGNPRVELERHLIRRFWREWWGRDANLLWSLRPLPLIFNPFRDYLTPNPHHIPVRGTRMFGAV